MQMRGNLHRYRVSSSGKRNRMLQGTFIPSYRAVLKFAAYGLLYTLAKYCWYIKQQGNSETTIVTFAKFTFYYI